MRTEFDRLQQRLPMETMSMKRYELPPPPAGKLTDMSAWNECLENSMAQLEHQATRYIVYIDLYFFKIIDHLGPLANNTDNFHYSCHTHDFVDSHAN